MSQKIMELNFGQLKDRDAYNGILNPVNSNPSVVESKNQFFKYLD